MGVQHAAVLLVLSLTAVVSRVHAQSKSSYPPVLEAERAELSHSFDQLKKQQIPPYFLSYEIIESHSASVSGSFGALSHSNENQRRQLLIDLRVGDYDLDNTRQVRGNPLNFSNRYSMIQIPIEDDPVAIRNMLGGTIRLPLDDNYDELRREIWLATDGAYKKALEDLSGKRAALQDKNRTENIPELSGNSAILAYRVYEDGHEQLVRNADVSGLDSGNSKEILAVSKERIVYTEATPLRNNSLFNFNAFSGERPLISYVVP
jgi:hypothetical protein